MSFQLWKWLDISSKWKVEITSLLSISVVSGNWADCKERIPNTHAWRLWRGGPVYFWCNIKRVFFLASRGPMAVCAAMEKGQPCLQQGQGQCHSFCLIVLQSLHNLPRAPVATRAAWSVLLGWRAYGPKAESADHWARENELLCSPGIMYS